MTDHDIIQAISVNLLRISQWYYVDSVGNKALCERYLDQSKQLSKRVMEQSIQSLLGQVGALNFEGDVLSEAQKAERCLTLGVLLSSRKI